MAAIRAGKHVYCQKPLTHTLHECRELTKAARAAGVATQMGNQGHATEGARLTNEWIQAGVIGDVREVHVWSDRAGRLWKQGIGRPDRNAPRSLDSRLEPLARARFASGPTTRPMHRSSGAAGGTSAPARSATWAATSSIIPSGR